MLFMVVRNLWNCPLNSVKCKGVYRASMSCTLGHAGMQKIQKSLDGRVASIALEASFWVEIWRFCSGSSSHRFGSFCVYVRIEMIFQSVNLEISFLSSESNVWKIYSDAFITNLAKWPQISSIYVLLQLWENLHVI